MSKQTDYTPAEWKTISAAPVMAGLLVSVADMSGPLGLAKEAMAVAKAVGQSAAGAPNELIKSVAEGIKALGGQPDMPNLPGDRAGIHNLLVDGCKQAAAVVAQKSPAEAAEYNRWLVSLAQSTAQASKEGGFLGIGGTLISEAESSAVTELAAALKANA
ncbi:MAG: hypothetical protein ACREBD_02880 [Blastocatellia bacterium]